MGLVMVGARLPSKSPPKLNLLRVGRSRITVRNQRIPHREILRALQDPAAGFTDIVGLYRDRILSVKTRTMRLLGRKFPARIVETLLGYEVKASYKRIHCPDLVTARYIKVFTELGCKSIRLPYDPSITAELVPMFEEAVAALLGGIRDAFSKSRTTRLRATREICRILRNDLRRQQESTPTN